MDCLKLWTGKQNMWENNVEAEMVQRKTSNIFVQYYNSLLIYQRFLIQILDKTC